MSRRNRIEVAKRPFPILWVVGGVFGVLVLLGGGLFVALVFKSFSNVSSSQQNDSISTRVMALPTHEELNDKLAGKTESDVLKLLGKPRSTSAGIWTYDDGARDRITGKETHFYVFFQGGTVRSIEH